MKKLLKEKTKKIGDLRRFVWEQKQKSGISFVTVAFPDEVSSTDGEKGNGGGRIFRVRIPEHKTKQNKKLEILGYTDPSVLLKGHETEMALCHSKK